MLQPQSAKEPVTGSMEAAGAGGSAPSPQSEAVTNELQELSLQLAPKLLPIQQRKNGEAELQPVGVSICIWYLQSHQLEYQGPYRILPQSHHLDSVFPIPRLDSSDLGTTQRIVSIVKTKGEFAPLAIVSVRVSQSLRLSSVSGAVVTAAPLKIGIFLFRRSAVGDTCQFPQIRWLRPEVTLNTTQ